MVEKRGFMLPLGSQIVIGMWLMKATFTSSFLHFTAQRCGPQSDRHSDSRRCRSYLISLERR